MCHGSHHTMCVQPPNLNASFPHVFFSLSFLTYPKCILGAETHLEHISINISSNYGLYIDSLSEH